jgi:manganese-dependent inorganic pyrophosphatase
MIYIIGHKKPDLDSTASAITLATFQNSKQANSAIAVLADPVNNETKFILNKFNIEIPKVITATDIKKDDQVILVDHNEKDQRLDNLNPEQIIGIFDHHKINADLPKPIRIDINPIGSTCTLLWLLFQRENFNIEPKIASIMLSGILSDTVGFKSPTTTNIDKIAGANLAEIAKTPNIDALTLEIFKAKSNVKDLTDKELIKNDYKIFEFGGKKVFIGQVETVEQEEIINTRKESLLKAMMEVKQQESVDLIYLVISDILKINSKIIIVEETEKDIAEKAFSTSAQDSILDAGPRISRKKEIAPPIEKILTLNN